MNFWSTKLQRIVFQKLQQLFFKTVFENTSQIEPKALILKKRTERTLKCPISKMHNKKIHLLWFLWSNNFLLISYDFYSLIIKIWGEISYIIGVFWKEKGLFLSFPLFPSLPLSLSLYIYWYLIYFNFWRMKN